MPNQYNQAHFCEMCSSEHEYLGKVCSRCGMCYKTCIRVDEGCEWFTSSSQTNSIPSKIVGADGTVQPSLPAYENLKGAFESWLVSSKFLNHNDSDPVKMETVWKEFELFATEVLTPVDPERLYLQIDVDSGKFKTLEPRSLYRNQNGDYVLLQDKKRVRIGKSVAVM